VIYCFGFYTFTHEEAKYYLWFLNGHHTYAHFELKFTPGENGIDEKLIFHQKKK